VEVSYWSQVTSTIVGRVAMTQDEAMSLEVALLRRPGIHLEIGVLWGGTLSIAGLAKGKYGMVLGCDPMVNGHWDDRDPMTLTKPTEEQTRMNIAQFLGLSPARWQLLRKSSNPWPFMGLEFSTVLIDGDHSKEAVVSDWENASANTTELIFLHDYNSDRHPGVQEAVDDVVMKDPRWSVVELVNTLLIMGKQ